MANKRKIGAMIALDGEKEFRQSVTSCNKALTAMRSEMKLVEAQTAGQANTLETLRSKHDVLARTLDAATQKEEAVRRGLEHAEEQYSKTGEELESYRRYLELAQASLAEMENSTDTTNEALEQQRQVVSDLSGIVEKGEETYKRAGDRVNDWKKQLNTAQAQTINATRALNENDALVREAEDSYDHCAKSIDAFGNEVDDTAEKLTSFGSTLKVRANEALIDFGKNAVTSAVQGATELQDASKKLAASTGATAEEMEKYSGTMEDIYNSGYGDSVTEIADGMAMVKQYTGEIDPTKLQELTENAMALDDTFSNMDMGETLRGVDSLMQNMGLDAEEAFDYIVVGAQNGLNKSGELTDNIAEYGQLWGQAGFSAQEMFTILQNGLDAGAYNLDKVNDFVKEFGISLSDGRIEENLSSFSTETQNLFLAWQNGEATTRDVFYSVINDLASMTNQQEALTIASNTWSALGEDNAMAVITSLTQVNNTYTDVRGSMESLKEVRYDSVTNEYKKLGRTMQSEVITPVLQKFLPVAQKGMKLLADNIDTIVPIAGAAGAAIGTMWIAKKATNTITSIKDTAKGIKNLVVELATHTTATAADTAATAADTVAKGAQATATGAATVAQEGLNTAMAANPVGLLITGIAALTAGIAAFISLSDGAKTELDEIKESAQETIDSLQESQDTLAASMQSAQESVDSAAASSGMAAGIAEELTTLATSTENTAEKQERMAVLVAELNQLYPDMGLEIDSVTGKLNMTNAELESYISNLEKSSMAQAYQDAFSEAFDAVADAQRELIDAEMEQEEIEDKLTSLTEDYEEASRRLKKAQEDGRGELIEWNGETQLASNVMGELEQQIYELEQTNKDLTKEIKDQKEVVTENTEVADSYMEKAMEMNETTVELTESQKALSEACQNASTIEQAQAIATQERNAAAEITIETAGRELEAYKSLSEGQQQVAVDVTNAVLTMQENLQGSIETQLGLFETLDTGAATSMDSILAGLNSQISGVQTWEENLNTLIDWGINNDLLQTLIEAGPKTGSAVQAIVDAGAERIGELNSTWDLKTQVMNVTNEAGQELMTNGATRIAESFDGWSDTLKASGADGVMGLVEGIVAAQDQATAAGEDLGVKTIDSIDSGLGVASPSWKARSSGLYVGVGLANGLRDGQTTAESAAKQVGYLVISGLQQRLDSGTINNIGYNVSIGLASGIRSGESEVIRAAQEVAQAAITAANNKLEIHSPSHVFWNMGENSMDSYASAVMSKKREVERSVINSLDMKLASRDAKIRTNTAGAGIDYNLLAATMVTALKQAGLVIKYNGREFGRVLSDMGVAFNNG